MKRTRKWCGKKLKYYHCGEYGEACRVCGLSRKKCTCLTFIEAPGRPHYHALLFGLSFVDQKPWKPSADGSMVYTSEALCRLWPAGFSSVGAVTFNSAAYVARYAMKKKNGKEGPGWYEKVEPSTGEVITRLAEYTTMSLKPAIAKDWYATFKSDVYPSDFLVLGGKKMKPPKYYDRLLELEDPEARARIKEQRTAEALLRQGDATSARLRVREECKLAQIKTLKRETE